MKTCTRCGETKPLSAFSARRGRRCKPCHVKDVLEWAKKNRGERRSYAKAYMQSRRALKGPPKWTRAKTEEERHARRAAARKRWAEKNPGRMDAARRAWNEANPGRLAAKVRTYQAAKRRAVPPWANKFFIDEIYDHRVRLEKALGIPMDVDHIVPLTSDVVCGLHWEGNLRIIPRGANRSKGNKHPFSDGRVVFRGQLINV